MLGQENAQHEHALHCGVVFCFGHLQGPYEIGAGLGYQKIEAETLEKGVR